MTLCRYFVAIRMYKLLGQHNASSTKLIHHLFCHVRSNGISMLINLFFDAPYLCLVLYLSIHFSFLLLISCDAIGHFNALFNVVYFSLMLYVSLRYSTSLLTFHICILNVARLFNVSCLSSALVCVFWGSISVSLVLHNSFIAPCLSLWCCVPLFCWCYMSPCRAARLFLSLFVTFSRCKILFGVACVSLML